ncbi:glycosyltransferase [Aeribacillus pallidus]|nr:glycosyltransferase [Aeribacillus pallidus]
MKKIKLMLLAPSLRGGGSERVMLNLIQNFDRRVLDLYFVLVKKEGPYEKEIPNDVQVFDLNCRRTLKAWRSLIKCIDVIKPDVILSTASQLNILLLMIKPLIPKKIKIIIREGSIPSENIQSNRILWRYLYRKYYNQADVIICQSSFMKKDLLDNFKIDREKVKQIYNPVNFENINMLIKGKKNPYLNYNNNLQCINILTVGRLSSEKGHRELIKSIPLLKMKRSNVNLFILGEGPLKNELFSLVRELNLEDCVHFVGFQENPFVWMKYADLFILPSKYEGLPNVLLEAIACQVPVIVTNHPGGTKEIMEITQQAHRIIDEFTWDDWWFEKPTKKTYEILEENFNILKIVNKYESLILELFEVRKNGKN